MSKMASPKALQLTQKVQPIVVILGATGTGKSKLAVQLAKHFNGEVISADSMQVYKGLDIITNKVTDEEQDGVTHHLLGDINPLSQFTIVDFRDRALPIIDRLLGCGKIPVIVGGTNYYIEALLWRQLIDQKKRYCSSEEGSLMLDNVGAAKKLTLSVGNIDYKVIEDVASQRSTDGSLSMRNDDSSHPRDIDGSAAPYRRLTETLVQIADGDRLKVNGPSSEAGDSDTKDVRLQHGLSFMIDEERGSDGFATINVEQSSSEMLHQILGRVDPAMAQKLHPNDKRKIVRSLQVYQQYGKRHSDLLEEQRAQDGGGPLGGPLRYKDPCIFWLQTNQEVLDKRLDYRVDQMIETGLLEELSCFHSDYNRKRLEDERDGDLYVHGIFQSIGFKEFHPYLTLPQEDKGSEVAQKLLKEGVERLKVITRQYARKQLKWVQNRFLKRPGEIVPSVYGLDSSDPSQWQTDVLQPALNVLQSIIEGTIPVQPPLERENGPHREATTHVCEVCDSRVFVGEQQWQGHMTSRRHKKRVARARKRDLNQKWQQALLKNQDR